MVKDKIIDVEKAGSDFVLGIRFGDGAYGLVDFAPLLSNNPDFSELSDLNRFMAFGLERGTLVWDDKLEVQSSWVRAHCTFILDKCWQEDDLKPFREWLGVSRKEFAAALSTSVETVKSWELKRRQPSGLAAKVIRAMKANPALLYQLIEARDVETERDLVV